MMRTLASFLLFLASTWLVVFEGRAAEPEPREVEGRLAPILRAAEKALHEGRPERALAELQRWVGHTDPVHLTMVGAARLELGELSEAERAFRLALELDRELRQARIGLVRVLVDTERWEEAAALVAELVDAWTAPAPELGLATRIAFERGDLRLAALLAERGIVRFPKDPRFRQFDLAVLIERGAWTEAREAALSLLAERPDDELAWRQLAAAADRLTEDPLRRLATLEAATLAAPDDTHLLRRHAFAQMQAGHTQAALRYFEPLVEANPEDHALLDAAMRVARAAGEMDLAHRWLRSVPTSSRTGSMTLLEAQLAIDMGETETGQAALTRLVDAGYGSSTVFLWAGQLAERAGDTVRAEVMYREAATFDDSTGGLAPLYLARLLATTHRPGEARALLRAHVLEHPADANARRLLELLGEAGR